jgi:hypothetical protein
MKNILKISKLAAMAMIAMSLFSCSTEDEISSSVTTYPVITVTGDESILVEKGETFTDPGVTATVGEIDVPVEVRYVGQYRGNIFNGTLDTSVSDVYTAEYTATNTDGFSRTLTRQVVVAETGDLENSIAGLYTSTVFRNGAQGNPASAYTDIEYILIWQNDDGTYGISDAFGGWYLFARAIAGSETPGTVIVANNIAANDFSFPGTQTNSYFGGSSEMTEMTVDAVARTIDFTTIWEADPTTTYTFDVHLEQVQLN